MEMHNKYLKRNIEKMNEAEQHTLPDFKTSYTAVIIKWWSIGIDQAYRLMDYDSHYRNYSYLRSIDFLQCFRRLSHGIRIVISLYKTVYPHVKE